MEPVYQRPSDLVLAVTRQELCYPFNILESRVVEDGSWRFGFHIVGESHIVRVERDGSLEWQEILACVTLPPSDLLHHHCFTGLRSHHWRSSNYAARVRFTRERPMDNPAFDRIQVVFPAVHGQTPFTSIGWQPVAGGMSWQTVHAYPGANEIVYVCSESTFDAR